MASRTIQQTPLIEILSPLLRAPQDAEPSVFDAAALAAAPHLDSSVREIPGLLMYARLLGAHDLTPALTRLSHAAGGLTNLPADALELLAWQYSVDFRELARTDEQLRAMVCHSIRWHRIKGTPASVKLALSLFGLNAEIEEDGKGKDWAVYQLFLPGVDTLDDVRLAHRVALEMQPARCRLRRVYNEHLDDRHLIWTTRPTWSKYYWSGESGILDPDSGVIASLGKRGTAYGGPVGVKAFVAGESLRGLLIRYVREWIWSYSNWSDTVFPLHAFVSGQFHAGVWQRRQPDWHFRGRFVCRSQLTWSGADLSPQAGQWSDINAAWCMPVHIVHDAPWYWGRSKWSDDPQRQRLVLCQLFAAAGGASLSADLDPDLAFCGHHQRGSSALAYPGGWVGFWDNRTWAEEPFAYHKSSELVPASGHIIWTDRQFWGWNDWSGHVSPPPPPEPPKPGNLIWTNRAAWSVVDWSGQIAQPLPPGPIEPGASIWSHRHTWSVNPWTSGGDFFVEEKTDTGGYRTPRLSLSGSTVKACGSAARSSSVCDVRGWAWSHGQWSDAAPAPEYSPVCADQHAARLVARKARGLAMRDRQTLRSSFDWSDDQWSSQNGVWSQPTSWTAAVWTWGQSQWGADPDYKIQPVPERFAQRSAQDVAFHLDPAFMPVHSEV